MTIVGFNFIKVKAEKKNPAKGKININNTIKVTDIKESDLSLDKSKMGLKVEVEFVSSYDPDIGSISLTGEVLLIEDSKKAGLIVKSWKDKKVLPQDSTTSILNVALTKSNVEALILSQLVNLPPPVQLPKVQVAEPKK